ncbi:MAG: response regulator transcription factor [Cyclobacteriaceae bacterium]
MKKIKTLLADDHAIVVEGLQQVLSRNKEIEVVDHVENGEEVLRFLQFNEVDVVVLDINMPVMDGLTCSREIKKRFPDVKIVILTMYPQRTFVDEIVKIGVDGCLLKNNTGKELTDAILRVTSGKQYYDRIRSFNSEEEQFVQHKLSARELDIIRCMSEGMTSEMMADKLFISSHTVHTHRRNILRKLNMNNSSEVVQFAVSQKLI